MYGDDARRTTLLVATGRELLPSLAAALEAKGFACIRAASSSLALDMLTGLPRPEVVILDDDFLAGVDAREFFRSFDGNGNGATHPTGFVLVSTGRFAELIPSGWETRMQRLWIPFEMEDLLRAVNRALNGRKRPE